MSGTKENHCEVVRSKSNHNILKRYISPIFYQEHWVPMCFQARIKVFTLIVEVQIGWNQGIFAITSLCTSSTSTLMTFFILK